MDSIFNFFSNLKFIYFILTILVMMDINVILSKRKINSSYRYFVNGISLIVLIFFTNYFNDIINGIFTLNFLSVKLYIMMLIIVNIIILIMVKKRMLFSYKFFNWLLFSLINLLFVIVLILVIGSKLDLFLFDVNRYTVSFLNISLILFVIYLCVISLIFIIRNIFFSKNVQEDIFKLKKCILFVINGFKNNLEFKKKSNASILTEEELFSMDKKNLYINGIDCSIIFEDSVRDNIFINYQILTKDINATMVNGFTLEENKLLKSICSKLGINNLENIDLDNRVLLNKIDVLEYNLLKKIMRK